MKNKRVRIAVIGANGRMGQEIQKVISAHPRCLPFLGVVREGSAKGFLYSANDLSSALLEEADVWIDFSSLQSFSKVMAAAKKSGKPLVSGVTGLQKKHQALMKMASKETPLLWSPNMSFGIAALKKALAIARELHDFDFQIEEIHHRHKVDKPSGTALYLQEALEKNIGKKLPPALAVRGGGIFGVHKVWMMSSQEVLTFEHQALSRGVFAQGAAQAALWLSGKKAGLYTMDDLFAGKK